MTGLGPAGPAGQGSVLLPLLQRQRQKAIAFAAVMPVLLDASFAVTAAKAVASARGQPKRRVASCRLPDRGHGPGPRLGRARPGARRGSQSTGRVADSRIGLQAATGFATAASCRAGRARRWKIWRGPPVHNRGRNLKHRLGGRSLRRPATRGAGQGVARPSAVGADAGAGGGVRAAGLARLGQHRARGLELRHVQLPRRRRPRPSAAA